LARKESLLAEIELATARRNEAEQLKENMFIRAPFDGTVISKDAEVGESIMPGGMGAGSGRGSVATIADLSQLDIECDVKEDFITRVSESQAAEISVDAVPDKKYQGKVYKIIPMGDRARATIKVIVEILDADEFLFPEMSATVYFLPRESTARVDDSPRFFCPDNAVTRDSDTTRDSETGGEGDAAFVWTVDANGRAQKIAVTVSESRDGMTEVLEGLTGEERLIANPQSLVDGESVKVGE
jgi:RND family efflux transporter MFP subunit